MKRWYVLLSLSSAVSLLQAGGTATWEMNNYRDFIQGRFSGVALSRDGRLRLAPALETALESEQPVIWSVARAADGTVYAGTGHRGRVFRIDRSGTSSLLWTAEEPEVFAVAVDAKGTVYAATSPNGRIYRIENGKAVEFFNPRSTYVWSLACAPDGALYAGTGDQGTVWRVDARGQGEVYYETGQSHITALALDAKGRLLAGTEPNGILYRIEARGRATVLYDAALPEIRAIRVAEDGVIYAAAQGGASMRRALSPSQSYPALPPPPSPAATATSITVTEEMQAGLELRPRADAAKPAQSSPQVTTQFAPVSEFPGVERSALYKILPDNTVVTLWSSKEESVYDIVPGGGDVYLATDAQGRIYRLEGDGKATLIAQTNEGEVTRLVEDGGRLLAATANSGKVYRLGDGVGASGSFESPVHDAGSVARWGRISWLAEDCRGCRLVLRTRSGNSLRPDRTWSEWSAPLGVSDGAPVASPNARYIQWRAEFTGTAGQTPILDSVTLAYLPQNTPPSIKNIMVTPVASASAAAKAAPAAQAVSSSYSITVSDTADAGPATSAGTPTQSLASGGLRQLQITWQPEDPDNDRLTCSLHFRGQGEQQWKLLKADLAEPRHTVDGDVLADGKYFFRVTCSDLPGNSPATAREAELISPPVLVDNTPPLVTPGAVRRTAEGAEVEFAAADAASMLRRADYSVDAGPWVPAEPSDGIFDALREQITVRLSRLAPGEHLVVLRVYDSAENPGLAKVVLK